MPTVLELEREISKIKQRSRKLTQIKPEKQAGKEKLLSLF
jgi:hypothetical protein